MNIYLVSIRSSEDFPYMEKWDVYDSFVVQCESKDRARRIHPSAGPSLKYVEDMQVWVNKRIKGPDQVYGDDNKHHLFGWIKGRDIDKLAVELIGTALPDAKEDIILVSYYAG